jgi:hypothetical protein
MEMHIQRYIHVRLVLMLLITTGIATGCTSERTEEPAGSDTGVKMSAAEIYTYCGELTYGAIYALPFTSHLIGDQERLAAQPSTQIHYLIHDADKEGIMLRFHHFISQIELEQDHIRLSQTFMQWCDGADAVMSAENEITREEFLERLYQSDRFDYLFLSHLDNPAFQSDDLSGLDKMASLSSAQGNEVINTLLSDLAMQSDAAFREDLERFRQWVQQAD